MGGLGDLWHVGVVVDDLEAAMSELSAAFGVSWTSVNGQDVTVRTGSAEQTSFVRWAATSGEHPELEVIEARSGLWSAETAGGGALHHLAYWSQDIERNIDRLVQHGYDLEASGMDGDGRLRFAYLLSPSGIRVELGSEHTRLAWDAWVGGEGYGLEIA